MTKMSEADREKRRKIVSKAYKQGDSIRTIAAANGLSYGHVHLLLDEAHVPMRPRGGYHRKG